jgi:hypothetical protein
MPASLDHIVNPVATNGKPPLEGRDGARTPAKKSRWRSGRRSRLAGEPRFEIGLLASGQYHGAITIAFASCSV